MPKTLKWFIQDWSPFTIRYASNMDGRNDTYGIGWRRWVLFYQCRGSYGGSVKPGFSWCNYYGTGEGG